MLNELSRRQTTGDREHHKNDIIYFLIRHFKQLFGIKTDEISGKVREYQGIHQLYKIEVRSGQGK